MNGQIQLNALCTRYRKSYYIKGEAKQLGYQLIRGRRCKRSSLHFIRRNYRKDEDIPERTKIHGSGKVSSIHKKTTAKQNAIKEGRENTQVNIFSIIISIFIEDFIILEKCIHVIILST